MMEMVLKWAIGHTLLLLLSMHMILDHSYLMRSTGIGFDWFWFLGVVKKGRQVF